VVRRYLRRVVREQRPIASATSEAGMGGDLRRSIAAIETAGDRLRFEKEASTISYGAQADDLLTFGATPRPTSPIRSWC